MVAGILIPITFFIVSGFVLYFFLKSRHQERMLLIEKGVGGDDLKYLLGGIYPKGNGTASAKWGILLVSVGLAIMTGLYLQEFMAEEIMAGVLFLYPGIGLLIYYRLFGKKKTDDAEQQ